MFDCLKEKYTRVVEQEPMNTYFRKCGFVACDNFKDNPNAQYDILFTGMNPAKPILPSDPCDKDGLGEYLPTDSYPNPFINPSIKYFKNLLNIIPALYRDKTAYFDLFPFYEYSQRTLEERISKRRKTMAQILEISQEEIERIKPKLIIIANYSSGVYWGLDNACWMGYQFIRIMPEGFDDFEIFRIDKQLRSDIDRINQDLKTTQLEGSIAVRYHHKSQDGRKSGLTQDDCQKLLALFEENSL